MPSAWSLPPGSSTRYCWSGATPNAYLTSKSAGLPSGPSVRTMNLPSRRKKVDVTPACVKRASLKSPATVASAAGAIAAACCDSRHSAVSGAWHCAHAAAPT